MLFALWYSAYNISKQLLFLGNKSRASFSGMIYRLENALLWLILKQIYLNLVTLGMYPYHWFNSEKVILKKYLSYVLHNCYIL